jgi:uroporphyrinogen decarboxylase
MTMNSVERVHTALRGGQPDRVPVIEFVIDPNVASAAVPGCIDTSDCKDRLGMDSVGCGAVFAVVDDCGDGTYTDEWGVTYRRNPEVVAHPVKGPIASMADLRRYSPPDPEAPHRLGELEDVVRRYKGRRAITFHQRAAFMWSAYLNGLGELLANFLLERAFATALLDMVLEVHLVIARRAIRAGAEVIVLGDDYAHNFGPMMSPALFDHFILPRLTRMIDLIHEEGALAIKHSDGNMYPLLESIVASGADALNPIEPVAGMDLATTKRLLRGRMAMVGNVDCGKLLSHGTPQQVRETVRRCILDGAPGGGYLLSSSNSIHSSVNPRNLVAMVEAAVEFGTYSSG